MDERDGGGMRRSLVLVEGLSDVAAAEAVARRRGLDLSSDGIHVVAVGGYGGFATALTGIDAIGVPVLCDAGEARWVARAMPTAELYVCHVDLEDELIRALGVDAVEAIVDAEGDGPLLAGFRRQPAQRERPADAQLRRFLGTKSGRKIHYAGVLAAALDPDAVPAPIVGVLAAAYRPATLS